MAEFRTDEARRRYRHKLNLRERISAGHYVYEIVSPDGHYIGRTVLPRGQARIGKPLRAEIARQFRVPASDWDDLIDCRLSAEDYFARFEEPARPARGLRGLEAT